MRGPNLAPIINSDNQNAQFLLIFVWPGNPMFRYFCVLGEVEDFGRPHLQLVFVLVLHRADPATDCRPGETQNIIKTTSGGRSRGGSTKGPKKVSKRFKKDPRAARGQPTPPKDNQNTF